jgi:hypothetical protein
MPEKQHTYQNCSIIEACAGSMQLSTQVYTIIMSVLDQLEQLCMRHEGTYDNMLAVSLQEMDRLEEALKASCSLMDAARRMKSEGDLSMHHADAAVEIDLARTELHAASLLYGRTLRNIARDARMMAQAADACAQSWRPHC